MSETQNSTFKNPLASLFRKWFNTNPVKNHSFPSISQKLYISCRCLVLTSALCRRLSPFKRIAVATLYVSLSNEVTPLGPSANQHSLSRLTPPNPPKCVLRAQNLFTRAERKWQWKERFMRISWMSREREEGEEKEEEEVGVGCQLSHMFRCLRDAVGFNYGWHHKITGGGICEKEQQILWYGVWGDVFQVGMRTARSNWQHSVTDARPKLCERSCRGKMSEKTH